MPSLLLLTPLLLPLTQGEPCLTKQDMQDFISKMEVKDAENEELRMKVKEMELTTRATSSSVAMCAYQDTWDTKTATITYDSLLSAIGGDMDLNTGVFTALVGGTYSITVSGYSKGDRLDDVEASIGLYHNSKCVVKNWWYVYTNNYKNAQRAAITISRNLVSASSSNYSKFRKVMSNEDKLVLPPGAVPCPRGHIGTQN